jgi:hypothetical protein
MSHLKNLNKSVKQGDYLRVEPACKRRVRGEDEEGVNISEVLHMHA